jgi:hypothetical protein
MVYTMNYPILSEDNEEEAERIRDDCKRSALASLYSYITPGKSYIITTSDKVVKISTPGEGFLFNEYQFSIEIKEQDHATSIW